MNNNNELENLRYRFEQLNLRRNNTPQEQERKLAFEIINETIEKTFEQIFLKLSELEVKISKIERDLYEHLENFPENNNDEYEHHSLDSEIEAELVHRWENF